ncbi:hypothetical protein JCM3765_002794 [Sporobolomyces pararoseus]
MFSSLWPTSNSIQPQSPPLAPSSTGFSAALLSHFPPSGSFSPSDAPNDGPLDSFWTKNFTSPLSDQGKDLQLPEQADVVVIGSGLTGVFAVDQLVEQLSKTGLTSSEKLKIVVLEARGFCSGATARNGGHLTASPLLSFAALEAEFGTEEAKKCVAIEQCSIDQIIETCQQEGWTEEVELRIGGGNLLLLDSEDEVEHLRFQLDAAKRAGQDLSGFEWLTSEQVLERYRANSKAGGILIPGNNVYPLKLVTKLFQRAQSRAKQSNSVSLDLFTHCTVSGVDRSDENTDSYPWVVTTASRGSIAARHILHCTNGYLSSVLPQFSIGPSRIYPTRGQVVSIVSPRDSDPSSWPQYGNAFLAEQPFDIYMFQRSSQFSQGRREVILGGCRDRSGPGENYEFGKSFDGPGSVNEEVGKGLREFPNRQFPKVFSADSSEEQLGDDTLKATDWEVDMEWTGIMGFREGGIPIVGPIYLKGERQDGQWVSAGYSGHGMPRAPASGHLLGSLVCHALGQSTSPPSKFTLPSHFPRHYLTTSSGLPDVEATVPGETDIEVENGCIWVDKPSPEIRGKVLEFGGKK